MDQVLNHPDLVAAPNVVIVLVSATPYNAVTSRSRVANHNIVSFDGVCRPADDSYTTLAEVVAPASGMLQVDKRFAQLAEESMAAAQATSRQRTCTRLLTASYVRAILHASTEVTPEQREQQLRVFSDALPEVATIGSQLDVAQCLSTAAVSAMLRPGAATSRRMIVIRTCDSSSKGTGQRLAQWLRRAREVAGLKRCFAISTDFGGAASLEVEEDFLPMLPEEVQAKTKLCYEDLFGLPMVLILCAKGRMGDTFPKSLGLFDLRCVRGR